MRKIFFYIFGSFSWKLPPWLSFIFRILAMPFVWLKNSYKKNKKSFFIKLGGVGLVLASVIGGWTYYESLPKPVTVGFSQSKLWPTPLSEGSKPYDLIITFDSSVAPLSDIGKVVSDKIQLNPSIEGEWTWSSERKLVFKVRKDWPIGTVHRVNFNKDLVASHIKLKKYSAEVKMPALKITGTNTEFYQNPVEPSDKKVMAEVSFTHPIDTKSFAKYVNLKFIEKRKDGKVLREEKLKSKVTFDESKGTAFIQSEKLRLPNYASEVRVSIEKGFAPLRKGKAAKEGQKRTVKVPGMLTFFRINRINLDLVKNDKFESEQVLIVDSTARISSQKLTESLEVFVLPKFAEKKKKSSSSEEEELDDALVLAEDDSEEQRSFKRWSMREITADVLSKAEKLKLTSIPTEHDTAYSISYKYDLEPGRMIYLKIKEGLESFGGYRLPETYNVTKRVPEFPKEVQIMSDGVFLSLSGDKKLSLLARDQDALKYKVSRVLPSQLSNVITQTYGDLKKPYFSYYSNSFENTSEIFTEVIPLVYEKRGKTQYTHFDFSDYLAKKRGVFYLDVRGWDRIKDSYVGGADQRLIIVTDLGIIAKRMMSGSYKVYVQSLSTGRPVSGAKVEVMGKNGLPVMTKFTSSSGVVEFGKLSDFRNEKSAIAFTVNQGEDFSFLPISSHVSSLNYSKFEVGGLSSRANNKGVSSYMFSDRGIYRPGEEVRLGYILKQKNWSKELSKYKVKMKVYGPQGKLMNTSPVIKMNSSGLGEYKFLTEETWPTGSYQASLYIYEQTRSGYENLFYLSTTNLKVEEFQPDRLRIDAQFSEQRVAGWVKPDELKAQVSLQNLFGTPAQNRKIKGEISLSPTVLGFSKYSDWLFYDETKAKKTLVENLGEKFTDENGKVEFDFNLGQYEQTSFLLRFLAEGFETKEGGRSVIATNKVLVSSHEFLVGYKSEGRLDYINKDAQRDVKLIAINSQLDKVEAKDLILKLIEYKKVSTLVKKSNGSYKYETVKKEYELKSQKLNLPSTEYKLNLPSDVAGDFSYVIENKKGHELNRINFSVLGVGNLSFALDKNSELQVKLNKEDYKPGEEIELNIRAPFTGAGLITIEKDKVYTHKWFKSGSKSFKQYISVPRDLVGNGYVNVTFVRSLDSDEIFMNPLSTSVIPFSVDKTKKKNTLSMKVTPLVRPGKKAKVTLKSKERVKAIVFAVDKGVLQVAKYKAPDPIKAFLKKRSLEVTTKQFFDLLLPEYSKIYERLSSESGGVVGAKLLGKNMNPFKRKSDKVMAYWSGVLDVVGGEKEIEFEVPDYFSGEIQVMAVTVSSEKMGAIQKKILSRGHFVLSPNVPLFVSPGDEFTVSTGVSNLVEGSGENLSVALTLKAGDLLKASKSKQDLKISEGSETSASFNIKAGSQLGETKISLQASAQGKSSSRTLSLSVRPASAYLKNIRTGAVSKGKEKKIDLDQNFYKEFLSKEVSFSNVPFASMWGVLDYLKGYPYGCTEQMVSKAFPQLVLSEYQEDLPFGDMNVNVKKAIDVIISRQHESGGFITWPSQNKADQYFSVYVLHYLTMAMNYGHYVPNSNMIRGLNYLKSIIKNEPQDLENLKVQSYAAYVLTQNDVIVTKNLSGMSEWLTRYKPKELRGEISLLFMAASYKTMKADERAEKMLLGYRLGSSSEAAKRTYNDILNDESIRSAFEMLLISKHFKNELSYFSEKVLEKMITDIGKNLNTLSASLTLVALNEFSKASSLGSSNEDLKVFQKIKDQKINLALSGNWVAQAPMDTAASELIFENKSPGLGFYSVLEKGFKSADLDKASHSEVEVLREYTNLKGENISKTKLGDEIEVKIKARSLNKRQLKHISIVDLLPGGFEVVLDSLGRGGYYDHLNVREDRVLIFTSLPADGMKEFKYKIKAISKGVFKTAPVLAESMYNRKIKSIGVHGSMRVE